MDRGDKPPPSHASLTWACDREAHTTGCVLKGSKVVETWEIGPILGVPCCVEMRTLLQCICPHRGGDSASVGSLCHVSFPYCCSHKVITISLCPFLTSSFSPYSSPLPPLLRSLPPGIPPFLIPALVSNMPFPLSITEQTSQLLMAPQPASSCIFPSSSLTKMTPNGLFLEL